MNQLPTTDPSARPASLARLWLIVFLAAMALYLSTSQRSLPWQDSGIRAWQVAQFDLQGDLGLALAHPGYVVMAQVCRLAPAAYFAAAVNAFSGLGMAVALANLTAVMVLLTGRRWLPVLAVAMLAVAHTPWWLSTIAETYTWSLAGLTAELWLLVVLLRNPRWQTVAALALVNGLGLCMHNFALLGAPVYAVVVVALVARRRLSAWSLAAAGAAWVLGAGLYLGLTIHEAVQTGDTLAAIRSALVGRFGADVLNASKAPPRLKENAILGGLNFINVLLPLAAVGWWHFRRRLGAAAAGALGAVTVIEVLFVVRYSVSDQFTFLLPSLAMVTVAASVGAAVLADRSGAWRTVVVAACVLSVLAGPAVYAAAPHWARRVPAADTWARRSEHRDELRYWLTPWKHNEDSAEQFAAAALTQAEPTGVILPDSTSKYVLLLMQWRDGAAPDVAIQHIGRPLPIYTPATAEAFRTALGGRVLYAVKAHGDHIPAALLTAARIKKPAEHEVLYRLELDP